MFAYIVCFKFVVPNIFRSLFHYTYNTVNTYKILKNKKLMLVLSFFFNFSVSLSLLPFPPPPSEKWSPGWEATSRGAAAVLILNISGIMAIIYCFRPHEAFHTPSITRIIYAHDTPFLYSRVRINIQKKRQRSPLLFGGQNWFNALLAVLPRTILKNRMHPGAIDPILQIIQYKTSRFGLE